jgi:hypothetical protein
MQISQSFTMPPAKPSSPKTSKACCSSRSRRLLLATAGLLALAAGCGLPSKQSGTPPDAGDWKARYEAEKARCEAMEGQALSALPQTLQQIRLELSQANQQLPGKVRDQLQGPLNSSFAAVAKQLDQVEEKTAHLADQLASVQQAQRTAHDSLVHKLDANGWDGPGSPSRVAGDLSDLLKEIGQFDQLRLNCHDCPERIRVDSHSHDMIVGLHKKIYDHLREIVIHLNNHGG